MKGVQGKLDKQIAYQLDAREGETDLGKRYDWTVLDTDACADFIAGQLRQPVDRVRAAVKDILERYVTDGIVRRWEDVHGRSARPIRADQYLIVVPQT